MFAFVVFVSVSVLSQEIGWEERLCFVSAETWNLNQSINNQSINQSVQYNNVRLQHDILSLCVWC